MCLMVCACGDERRGYITYPVAAGLTGDVLGDLDVGPLGGGGVGVDHAGVWAGTVTVDLVDGHLDLATGGDLRQHVTGHGHDGLGTGVDVVAATPEGLADGVSGIALEAGGVLLAGVSPGGVTGSVGVDTESHARAATGGGGLDDGTVASHEGDEGVDDCGLHYE